MRRWACSSTAAGRATCRGTTTATAATAAAATAHDLLHLPLHLLGLLELLQRLHLGGCEHGLGLGDGSLRDLGSAETTATGAKTG